ncbi:MAG: hypothetical protein KC438_02345, partial [Thermomicrobiales bacterium]|nr:hypothetical protein [Thermomicrobiales bacterium]
PLTLPCTQVLGVPELKSAMKSENPSRIAEAFFEAYQRALLDRDAPRIASHYAVPALIEFPGQAIPVSSSEQTEQFFRGAFAQYQGVTEAHAAIVVVAATGHSIWADVTWTYDGDVAGERNLYQLVHTDGAWKIAVLTPLNS